MQQPGPFLDYFPASYFLCNCMVRYLWWAVGFWVTCFLFAVRVYYLYRSFFAENGIRGRVLSDINEDTLEKMKIKWVYQNNMLRMVFFFYFVGDCIRRKRCSVEEYPFLLPNMYVGKTQNVGIYIRKFIFLKKIFHEDFQIMSVTTCRKSVFHHLFLPSSYCNHRKIGQRMEVLQALRPFRQTVDPQAQLFRNIADEFKVGTWPHFTCC